MKIGYICNQGNCVSGASNGIRMQALIWREELVRRGHEVVLINAWDVYDWNTFDIIHAFSFGDSISFLHQLKKRGLKIVCSPIIDSNENKFLYKLSTRWGSQKFRLSSPGFNLRQQSSNIDLFLARTEHEAGYIRDCFDISAEKVAIVPLSYRSENTNIDFSKKEKFCFHVSLLTQPRKNVLRLVQAAIKYKFRLVLAGSTKPEKDFAPFKKLIESHDNIECLGFVSDEQLENLYSRAKVFALPSINEGVGYVALEAAMHGCDIVITNVGGPKEYYKDGLVHKIDPFSVDEIGKAVLAALEKSNQPELMEYIKSNYDNKICVAKLENLYKTLV